MDKQSGLTLLRQPFPAHLISKLPKGTKAQNEALKADRTLGISCQLCGQWHHKNAVHLDYVGHAALTDRLLDADPLWSWEPCAFGPDGLPAFDKTGGLWIRLTVCGHSRLGYGHAESSTFKDIGSREKEVIGDALRNAAMRFGAALDLWHKGDLHADDDGNAASKPKKPDPVQISPVKEAAKATPITAEEAAYVMDIGGEMVDLFHKGQEIDALALWRTVSDNDIKTHIWNWLQSESKLRSFLKANKT
jgi:hypothetical protein